MRVPRSPRSSAPKAVPLPKPADPLANRRARIDTAARQEEQAVRESNDDVVACPTDSDFLTRILNRSPREVRPMRPGDYLHVSDLLGKCVRKIVLSKRHSTPIRPQRLSPSDQIAFAQGDAIHDVIKSMATASTPSRVWGKWRCKCGNLFHGTPCTYAETDPDDICELCGTPTNEYEEVSLRDDDTMIVGNPDLIFYLAELAAYHITEIKSMAEAQFAELTRPKPEHVLQVLFYWYLMRKLGYRVTDRVSILYVTKNYKFVGSVWKEYMIDPYVELHRLDIYLADAYAAKASRLDPSAALPSRVCTSEFTVDAKKCELCNLCFAV
jgi:hypothetical protein